MHGDVALQHRLEFRRGGRGGERALDGCGDALEKGSELEEAGLRGIELREGRHRHTAEQLNFRLGFFFSLRPRSRERWRIARWATARAS